MSTAGNPSANSSPGGAASDGSWAHTAGPYGLPAGQGSGSWIGEFPDVADGDAGIPSPVDDHKPYGEESPMDVAAASAHR
jgi:hypothetical protein